jgi:hypothetical protein
VFQFAWWILQMKQRFPRTQTYVTESKATTGRARAAIEPLLRTHVSERKSTKSEERKEAAGEVEQADEDGPFCLRAPHFKLSSVAHAGLCIIKTLNSSWLSSVAFAFIDQPINWYSCHLQLRYSAQSHTLWRA